MRHKKKREKICHLLGFHMTFTNFRRKGDKTSMEQLASNQQLKGTVSIAAKSVVWHSHCSQWSWPLGRPSLPPF